MSYTSDVMSFPVQICNPPLMPLLTIRVTSKVPLQCCEGMLERGVM